MRARRLAKLAASSVSSETPKSTEGAATSTPASNPASDGKEKAQAQAQADSRPGINIKRAQPAATTSSASQSSTSPAPHATPSGISGKPKKRRASEIDPASARPPAAATEPPPRRQHAESLEEWTDHTLASIFRISVDSSHTKDRHGHPLTFLPGLSQELTDRGQALMLTVDDLDPAILEAGTAFQPKKPLMDYFLPSWKNIIRATKQQQQQRDTQPRRVAVLHEAKRLCMSNCIFALTMPEYFG